MRGKEPPEGRGVGNPKRRRQNSSSRTVEGHDARVGGPVFASATRGNVLINSTYEKVLT